MEHDQGKKVLNSKTAGGSQEATIVDPEAEIPDRKRRTSGGDVSGSGSQGSRRLRERKRKRISPYSSPCSAGGGGSGEEPYSSPCSAGGGGSGEEPHSSPCSAGGGGGGEREKPHRGHG